jgi:hypothetical protein
MIMKGYTILQVQSSNVNDKQIVPPFVVNMKINGCDTSFEIDSGSTYTLVNENTFKSWPRQPTLSTNQGDLRTYTGEVVNVLGSCDVNVGYRGRALNLPVYIVKGTGPNLLGRGWFKPLQINWPEVFAIARPVTLSLKQVVDSHQELFNEKIGMLKNVKAKLYVETNAKPRFYKPRPLPYILRPKVEAELDKLLNQGIIEAVEHAEWAAPIVVTTNSDSSVRICGDYSVTINTLTKQDRYPLPKIEDLYAKIAGGDKFTKLDLSHAYHQIGLDDEFKKFLTINTHRGLYQYNRLPFGVNSASGIFQRAMDNLVKDIPYTMAYLDDILVTGRNDSEHLQNLDKVLRRLSESGLKL